MNKTFFITNTSWRLPTYSNKKIFDHNLYNIQFFCSTTLLPGPWRQHAPGAWMIGSQKLGGDRYVWSFPRSKVNGNIVYDILCILALGSANFFLTRSLSAQELTLDEELPPANGDNVSIIWYGPLYHTCRINANTILHILSEPLLYRLCSKRLQLLWENQTE